MECKANECTNEVRCKGLCAYHYERERKKKLGVRCSEKHCEKIVFAKGLCSYHYQRQHHGRKRANGAAQGRTCLYDDCEREIEARSYCRKHYMRLYRHGQVVPDGYRKSGKKRGCIYCTARVTDHPTCRRHRHKSDKCLICDYDRFVEAAHLVPRAAGGPREAWNMVPLCPNHHRLYDGALLSYDEQQVLEPLLKRARRRIAKAARK